MKSIRVTSLVGKPFLVARESARTLELALRDREEDECGSLSLDFTGAVGVAPSFLDEALLVVEEHLRACGNPDSTVVFSKPPTILAAKHHAIARAHGRTLVVTENGDWEFRKF